LTVSITDIQGVLGLGFRVQVTIPRVWIGEHIFVVEFDVNGEYTVVEFDVNDSTHGENFRERKVPTENLERFSR
jgi:hypothetical protein